MRATEVNEREYARFDVCLNVRFRPLDSAEELEKTEQELLRAPSVWALSGESELWKLADSPSAGSDGLLAKALLDLAAQIERISRRVLRPDGPMEVGTISQISCGGARISTHLLLKPGARLLVTPMDDENEAPPISILAQVVHLDGPPDGQYGLAFEAMHPTDKKRLTRYIYGLQRRSLRRNARERA